MGTEQTLASRNSQENLIANKARSISDCSPHGLNLQRKANTVQNNANVMQRMAWVAIKKIQGLSGGGNEAQTNAPLDGSSVPANVPGSRIDAHGKRMKYGYNRHNLKLHHRHFVFSPIYNVQNPTPGEERIQQEIIRLRGGGGMGPYRDNNIGYGNDGNGGGVLYSEDFRDGFVLKERISTNWLQDLLLVSYMHYFNPRNGGKYSSYNVATTNCQDWVEDVRNAAGL